MSGGWASIPNNPNKNADGSAKTTNGLYATKAAVQYAMGRYPTSKYFLHGGSAGSAGAYYDAWSLQQQGIPPAGVVGDASVINVEAGAAAYQQGVCTKGNYNPDGTARVSQRFHPDVANFNNEIDKLVSKGELTVPLLHIWNHGDVNTCGSRPMTCPERDGSTPTVGRHRLQPRSAPPGHHRAGSGEPIEEPAALRVDRRPRGPVRQTCGDERRRAHQHRSVVASRLPVDDHELGSPAVGRPVTATGARISEVD